ncbi:ricin-type beta-trefoil lectin domain protein [Streptomyces sp. NPDC087851]|uniref:ricin-type beta-trefoil lectin domain protein n=1 Tax=Streptomyces sp. NPDC087851 TaxID=3365810 RepID=UPI003830980A
MRGNPRRPLWALSLLSLCAALGALAAPPRAHDAAPCENVLVGVAHQDDDLLFVNPDIQRTLHAGCSVSTVYLTAGDAGHPFRTSYYVRSREDGVRAAYAKMAGTADRWTRDDVVVRDRRLLSYTLADGADVRLTFLRLPDGLPRGSGTTTNHHQSLLRLFRGEIRTIRPVDAERAYTEGELVSTLTGLADREKVRRVRTLDYDNNSFGHQGTRTVDHSDHSDHAVAGRYFRRAAFDAVDRPAVTPYLGYSMSLLPANLSPAQKKLKEAVFATYYRHHGCLPKECPAFLPYGPGYRNWVGKEHRRTHRAARPGEIMSAIATTKSARTVQLCLAAGGGEEGAEGAEGAEEAEGAAEVATRACDGARAQSWTFDDGAVRSAVGGRCLTVPYGNSSAPSLSPCDGSPGQRWWRDAGGRIGSRKGCLSQDDLVNLRPRLRLARCAPYRPEVRWYG